MSLNHGINTFKSDTDFAVAVETPVGIPFFIGAWPCHAGAGFSGKVQLFNSFAEAVTAGGYSSAWRDSTGAPKWSLCEAVYSYFKLFGMKPAIFFNVFNPSTHKTTVAAATMSVKNHQITLPIECLDDSGLVVQTTGGSPVTLTKDTDYEVYYSGENCIVELISTSTHYSATSLSVAYNAANPGAITSTEIEAAVENVEQCKSILGVVPDLLCAPGWSSTASVAAVMAAKAASINGIFKAKAVVDLDTSSGGADDYSEVLSVKNSNGYNDPNMIVCWPLVKNGDKVFALSTIMCGLMAQIDSENGSPYESPSNKTVPITGACVKAGTEVYLSITQADVVSYSDGVVTVLNNDGWRAWGNYTGCWPGETDVAKNFICTSRMMDYLCNVFVTMFWGYLDRPLTPVLVDAIINSYNSWLNGMTSDGQLYGGEISFNKDSNPTTALISGKFRLDTKVASPVPAQEIDMYVEYDVDMLTAAFAE